MGNAGVIARTGNAIELSDWTSAIHALDGIRVSPRGATEAEVFDSRYAEWVEAFRFVDGRIEVRDATAPHIARAAEALAKRLGAIVSAS